MPIGETVGDVTIDYHDVTRGIQKKVGEYEKLTGDLPAVWRNAREQMDRAEAAETKLKKTEKERKETAQLLERTKIHTEENENMIIKLRKENQELKATMRKNVEDNDFLKKEQVELENNIKKQEDVNQVEKETKAVFFNERVTKFKECVEEKNLELRKAKRLLVHANIRIKSLTESVEILESENGELSKVVRKEKSYWNARMLDYKNIDL